ncbi:MAG: thiamine phosphate synthase [Actinobacteria bacterium]|nr:thiamine phosphate synthase [Actinomycetota bacterium]MBU4240661.1 thiamine phosphate synthase [Actinomycetota bacterium]MBU4386653.1 thiamine phosphate synthase [Actinomycetota bacterium]MBU4490383.1 thiamine phosphate synthase [Actinomycetota bacterium]MCG2796141.1 thiamine phosphate synthase [Actinomycetes bacterium]
MPKSERPGLAGLMRMMVITSRDVERGRGHEDVARAALAAGCRAVQLRDKEMADRDFAEVALRIRRACRERGALFLVNDRVDVAYAVQSDGVHLGVEDLDVTFARRLLPPGFLVGFSPESVPQARAAVRSGADYLGVGPVFSTQSKPDAGRPIGLDGLSAYCREGLAPVIAVGGIDALNAAGTLTAGAAGAAVVSAVARAVDMEEAAREVLESLGEPDHAAGDL